MWVFMCKFVKALFLISILVLCVGLAACQSSGDAGFHAGSAQPKVATWRCTDGVRMTIRNLGMALEVSDTRGVKTELPPDPPGQRERYGKTGYALVFAGRTASWFASGKVPTDCRR